MQKNDQGLSEVRDNILARFRNVGLHEFILLHSPKTNSFGAYVFYRSDEQISDAESSGLSLEIQNSVLDELENVGRGNRDKIQVNFEFDSHEGVERMHGGDYYARLH